MRSPEAVPGSNLPAIGLLTGDSACLLSLCSGETVFLSWESLQSTLFFQPLQQVTAGTRFQLQMFRDGLVVIQSIAFARRMREILQLAQRGVVEGEKLERDMASLLSQLQTHAFVYPLSLCNSSIKGIFTETMISEVCVHAELTPER